MHRQGFVGATELNLGSSRERSIPPEGRSTSGERERSASSRCHNNTKFIILNTKFIIYNTKFIVLNTQFIILAIFGGC